MNTQTPSQQVGALIRLKDVLPRIGISKSKFYSMIQTGAAPAPIKQGVRISLWKSEDIDAYIRNLSNGGGV